MDYWWQEVDALHDFMAVYIVTSKYFMNCFEVGYVVVQLVEALRYKSEGCRFNS